MRSTYYGSVVQEIIQTVDWSEYEKKDFKELTGISQDTLNKLQNDGNVMVDIVEKICLNMDCSIADIMEIYP